MTTLSEPRAIDRAHAFCLIAYAALLALFEGPAEIACVALLLTTAGVGGYAGWRPRWYEIAILVWAAAGLFGWLEFDGHATSEEKTRPLLILAYAAGRCALGPASPKLLRRCAIAFVLCCALNAGYGYLQIAFGQLPLDDLLAKRKASAQRYRPGHFGTNVASGLFYHRLKLAHVAVAALGLLTLRTVADAPALSRPKKLALGFLGALIAGGVMFTYARMVWIAFAGALFGLFVLLARRRYILVVTGALTLMVAVVLLSGPGRERLANVGKDLSTRVNIMRLGVDVFTKAPIAGNGHGTYRDIAKGLEPDFGPAWVADPHNIALHVLAETGVIGFAAFWAAVIALLVRLVRRAYTARAAPAAGAVLLDRFVLFYLLVVLLLGFTHFTIRHATVGLMFWTGLGVAATPPRPADA